MRKHIKWVIDLQTDIQIIQIDRQTGRQTDKQKDRRTDIETETHTSRQT